MLDRACSYYMAIGVSYDDFWNGDYTRLKYELEAYRLKQEERNHELWLQGYYVYEATSVALANAFREKGKPPAEYRKEPIRITPQTEEEKEEEAKKTLETFKANLIALTGRLERREQERMKEAGMMLHGS